MPTLKYRDPADGTFKAVPGGSSSGGGSGGEGPNEVTVSDTQPTDGSELWMDLADNSSTGDYATADVALEAGWISWGSAYGPTVRLTRQNGIVTMEGTLNRSTDLAYVGNTMVLLGTVPDGFRPTFDIAFASNYYPNDGPMVAAKQMVRAGTGLVQLAPQVPDGTFKGGNTTVTMSGVWRAA